MDPRTPLPTDIERRLDNLIRLGTVAEVDHGRALCRVQTGGLLTTWLPWVTRRAGNTRTWCPPTVGEQALVLGPSGDVGAGIVITGLYTATHDQPSASPDEHVIDYPDGARISYDHAAGKLTITGMQHIAIVCPLITIEGEVIQQGGRLMSNGIVLHTHIHTGDSGGNTKGPK